MRRFRPKDWMWAGLLAVAIVMIAVMTLHPILLS